MKTQVFQVCKNIYLNSPTQRTKSGFKRTKTLSNTMTAKKVGSLSKYSVFILPRTFHNSDSDERSKNKFVELLINGHIYRKVQSWELYWQVKIQLPLSHVFIHKSQTFDQNVEFPAPQSSTFLGLDV